MDRKTDPEFEQKIGEVSGYKPPAARAGPGPASLVARVLGLLLLIASFATAITGYGQSGVAVFLAAILCFGLAALYDILDRMDVIIRILNKDHRT